MIQSVLLCCKDFSLTVTCPVCRLYKRISVGVHFFHLFLAQINETAVWTQWCRVSPISMIQEEKKLFQTFLPANAHLLPRCSSIPEFHQAPYASSDLILPWRCSSAKSFSKDCQGIRPHRSVIAQIKQHLLCSGPFSWFTGGLFFLFCAVCRAP